jgi:enoyl-CoA hydratase
VRELLAMPLEQAYRRQEEIGAPLRRTRDAAEGARAFAERRKPSFEGR